MLFSKKSDPHRLLAVCSGKCLPLSEMSDEVFSSGMLGTGVAFEPNDCIFYSPVSGTVRHVTETGHAYTVCSEDGLDLLIHIGVDTVGLGGKGFFPAVSEGQTIQAGDRLGEADISEIRKSGYDATTAVIVTTPEKIEDVRFRYGSVTGGKDTVLTYECRREARL